MQIYCDFICVSYCETMTDAFTFLHIEITSLLKWLTGPLVDRERERETDTCCDKTHTAEQTRKCQTITCESFSLAKRRQLNTRKKVSALEILRTHMCTHRLITSRETHQRRQQKRRINLLCCAMCNYNFPRNNRRHRILSSVITKKMSARVSR
jgi:hypothetical protein